MNKNCSKYLMYFFIFLTGFLFCDEIKEKKENIESSLKEENVETSHSVKIDGKNISYKAQTGTILLKDDDGKVKASIFYVAYHKDDVENKENRPITFCFNGGPGSASIWLHMGLLGPKRAVLDDKSCALFPYHLCDNDASILDVSDIVFIDPVSTGFSRPAAGEDLKQFHGVDEDIKYVGEFVRLFTARNNRWLSPKFLAGESYGTTRAVGLVEYLQDKYAMYFNGLILISSVLDFQTLPIYDSATDNDISYSLALPSLTAAAWYHQKLPSDLQQKKLKEVLKESEQFASSKYVLALIKGDLLSDVEKKELYNQLKRYTGLSLDYIDQTNGRIKTTRFAKELLRDKKRTLGRYDSRIAGIDQDHTLHCIESDPSADVIVGGYSACLQQYLYSDLNWKKDDPYYILGNVKSWNFGEKAENKYLNFAHTLSESMSKNRHLKVFVASGYFDLATPYYATDYTFNHLSLDASIRKNITQAYYEGGHMMYTNSKVLPEIGKDLKKFVQSATKNQTQ